jgi:hypothetical protein
MHWFDLVKIFPSKQPYHAGWIPSGKSRDDVRRRQSTHPPALQMTHPPALQMLRLRFLLLLLVRASRMNESIYLSIYRYALEANNATRRESKKQGFKPEKPTPVDTI